MDVLPFSGIIKDFGMAAAFEICSLFGYIAIYDMDSFIFVLFSYRNYSVYRKI
jgi:hypothetical protein